VSKKEKREKRRKKRKIEKVMNTRQILFITKDENSSITESLLL
jgi:hypothetical protein